MGEHINHFFEGMLQWQYDDGLVYINGRDVCAFIIGFIFCWILCYLATNIDEWRKNR